MFLVFIVTFKSARPQQIKCGVQISSQIENKMVTDEKLICRMRSSLSSLRNWSVCMMPYDLMRCVLYPLIWVLQFKSLLLSGVQWKQNKLGYMCLRGMPEAPHLSLKIITPSAYQSSERGGIIYREINSLRQSIEFYNLSGIGCIVPSAKATEFHVIKIKKKEVQEYAFNYHFSCNNFCLLAFILPIKRKASYKMCHNNMNNN